jgi:hypothetical protein
MTLTTWTQMLADAESTLLVILALTLSVALHSFQLTQLLRQSDECQCSLQVEMPVFVFVCAATKRRKGKNEGARAHIASLQSSFVCICVTRKHELRFMP